MTIEEARPVRDLIAEIGAEMQKLREENVRLMGGVGAELERLRKENEIVRGTNRLLRDESFELRERIEECVRVDKIVDDVAVAKRRKFRSGVAIAIADIRDRIEMLEAALAESEDP